MNILIFIHHYLPGYKAGGPLRTIANMAEALGNRYHFYIVTTNRDFGEAEPYENISARTWTSCGNAQVFYLSPQDVTRKELWKILNSGTQWDLIYLQSFWDMRFSILPLLLWKYRLKKHIPLLLAPRGEFGAGAMQLKSWKKKPYLFLARAFGWYNEVAFHCSSEDEKADLLRVFPDAGDISVALDVPDGKTVPEIRLPEADDGRIRLCFLSRLVPKKNLQFALTVLQSLEVPALFDIYGPQEDPGYWEGCQRLIDHMPPHIQVRYRGLVDHRNILPVLSGYDLFFFPTRNENFGHVIHEALRAGVPVLCSDQAPWHELGSRNAGWEIPLDGDASERFAGKLVEYARKNAQERLAMRYAALRYGKEIAESREIREDNIAMFEKWQNPKHDS